MIFYYSFARVYTVFFLSENITFGKFAFEMTSHFTRFIFYKKQVIRNS